MHYLWTTFISLFLEASSSINGTTIAAIQPSALLIVKLWVRCPQISPITPTIRAFRAIRGQIRNEE